MTPFNQILSPLNSNFLSAFSKLTESSVPIVEQVNSYLHENNGKQLRPLMMMLTALCCGFPSDANADHPLFSIAAAIETLHSSTLMHDDVVDNSDFRRGKPSVNKLWNNKIAVLMGDFYLAKVMHTLNLVDNKAVTAIINNAVIQMSEGELLQLQQSGIYSTDRDSYLSIIEKKTASFMSACCHVGAVFATDDTMLHEQARLFGLNIGMAFQIRDDILDYRPASQTGKPQGNDLKEGKCTLPLILLLQNSDADTKEKILSLLNNISGNNTNLQNISPNDTDLQTIIDAVSEGGYLAAASQSQEHFLSMARQSLMVLPDNQYREALMNLCFNLISHHRRSETVLNS